MKKGMSKALKIVIIGLIIIALVVAGYFLIKKMNEAREQEKTDIFQQGFTYGYTNAVMQIMNVSSVCQPFPVYLGNQSRELIAVDCLRQAQQ